MFISGSRSGVRTLAWLAAGSLAGCGTTGAKGELPVEAPDMACVVEHDLDAWRAAVERERRSAESNGPLIAVDVAAGFESTCAIDEEGKVWCWGWLDNRDVPSPREIDLGGPARAIDGSSFGYCAVLVNGSLVCFDPGTEGLKRTQFSRPATAVVMASYHALVRLDDGRYACVFDGERCSPKHQVFADDEVACVSEWGVSHRQSKCSGGLFRLGPSPLRCGGGGRGPDGCDGDVVERASTTRDQCERLNDGTVRCAGEYARRLVAAGLAAPPSVFDPFVRVPLPDAAVELVAGTEHMCARSEAGVLRCWGRNPSGQSGLGPRNEEGTPTPVAGLPKVVALHGGGSGFCALDSSDDLWCWGMIPAPGRDPASPCFNRVASARRVGNFSGYSRIEVDDEVVCGLDRGGRLRCRGWFPHPRLSLRPHERWVGMRNRGRVRDVTLDGALCVLRKDGLVTCRKPPHRCVHDCKDSAWFLDPIVEIDGHCARTSTHDVACSERIGVRTVGHFKQPIAQLRAADTRWCVRLLDGAVTCGDLSGSYEQTSNVRAVDVAVGLYKACAVTQAGRVACWAHPRRKSEDTSGALLQVRPWLVEGVRDAVSIAMTRGAACALLGDGQTRCWGVEGYGELGRGFLDDVLEPLTIMRPVGTGEMP